MQRKKGIAKYHADEEFQTKEVISQKEIKFNSERCENKLSSKWNNAKLFPRKETVSPYSKLVQVISFINITHVKKYCKPVCDPNDVKVESPESEKSETSRFEDHIMTYSLIMYSGD